MGKIKRLVRKRVIAILMTVAMLVLVLPAVPALAAENGMVLKTSKVSVWPEYDDPRVLIIFEGTFVNTGSTDFNGKVYFNVHTGAQIGMACEIVDGGGHSCQPYTTEAKGEDTQSLSWKTTRAIKPGEEYPVFLEYYYNPIKGTSDKTIDYTFQPSYKIEKLDLSIQQPLKAEKFSVNPAALSTSQDGEGFSNHNYTFTNKNANDQLNFKIAYTKTDPNPSKTKPENGNPAPQSTGGSSSGGSGSSLGTNAYLQPGVLIPGALFLAVLVGFIVFAVNGQSRDRQAEDRIKRIISKSKTDNAANGKANPKLIKEKKKIRQMLLNGQISEETYRELLAELEEEFSS
ncbi:MAG: hypothetical protein WA118_05245 [Carboxydocellales bacterium]